jgi:two-component system nitrogen regulation response regulator GlnG
LVQHYVRRFSGEFGQEVPRVPPETLEILRRYPWPGNVRELQSVLKQALLHTTGGILAPDFLPAHLTHENREGEEVGPAVWGGGPEARAAVFPSLPEFIDEQLRMGTENLYEDTLRRMERLLLTRVLQHTQGNQVQAARILGITRGSLRTKLRELGITIARTVAGKEEAIDQS